MLRTVPVRFICQTALNLKVARAGLISRIVNTSTWDPRSDSSLRRQDLDHEL